MGRPIKKQQYLGTIGTTGVAVPHQIQASVWGTNDSGPTAGYLTAQNSTNRFRATTVNGTSLVELANVTPVQGQATVKLFPIDGYPTVLATGNATVGTVGNGNVILGGIGYKVGDTVTAVGGTFATAAAYTVTANTGNGVISSLLTPTVAITAQQYSVLPANIAGMTTTTSGNGAGAIISSNFGLSTAYILTGGAGYSAPSGSGTAVVTFETGGAGTVEALVTNPTVTGGAVATGQLTVTQVGVLNAEPVVDVENIGGDVTQYVKYLTSTNYLETFAAGQYKWLPRGGNVPADYSSLNIPLGFLDTL